MTNLAAFVIAVICAGLMGFAIQSGATCTVYAVSELIERRRASRLIAMLEAGLWVAVTLLVAGMLRMSPVAVSSFGLSGYTIFGGLMLGLGAYVNGACVFGSVARLGSGEAGFLVTPLGFYLGIKLFEGAVTYQPMRVPQTPIGAAQLPFLLLAAFSLYALARLFRIAWTALQHARPQNAFAPWDPHEATLVIGLTFAIMLLAVGRWTYPELLSDLAMGELNGTVWRSALFVALLCGARLGGLVHGKTGWVSPTTRRIATCLVGGAMMGIGSASVPGGNDGLVLIGLPFLMPYALVALATMVVAIGLTIWGQRRFARPS